MQFSVMAKIKNITWQTKTKTVKVNTGNNYSFNNDTSLSNVRHLLLSEVLNCTSIYSFSTETRRSLSVPPGGALHFTLSACRTSPLKARLLQFPGGCTSFSEKGHLTVTEFQLLHWPCEGESLTRSMCGHRKCNQRTTAFSFKPCFTA